MTSTQRSERIERTKKSGDNPVDPEVGATRRELKGSDEVKDSTAHGGGWFGKPPEREPHEATTPVHDNQQPEESSSKA